MMQDLNTLGSTDTIAERVETSLPRWKQEKRGWAVLCRLRKPKLVSIGRRHYTYVYICLCMSCPLN